MIDYANIGAVCSDCARKAGFVPKKKTVGMWIGECDICHKEKPCSDLWHDWMLTKKKEKKRKARMENERVLRSLLQRPVHGRAVMRPPRQVG